MFPFCFNQTWLQPFNDQRCTDTAALQEDESFYFGVIEWRVYTVSLSSYSPDPLKPPSEVQSVFNDSWMFSCSASPCDGSQYNWVTGYGYNWIGSEFSPHFIYVSLINEKFVESMLICLFSVFSVLNFAVFKTIRVAGQYATAGVTTAHLKKT